MIEILITLAILFIIISVSLQSFARYAQKQQYLSAVDTFTRNLDMARQKTLASKGDAVYGMYVGTSTIEFFEGGVPTVGSSSNTILSYEESDITATSSFSNGAWYVTFARLTGEASATGTVSIFSNRLNASTTYTVYGSGLVE